MTEEIDTDIGHWKTELGKFNPDDFYGFVYMVTNNINQMRYIGRKNFRMKRRVKVKNRKNRKITYVKSNWLVYTTSSVHVNSAIEEHGMESFTFEIIELCLTKGHLSFRETELQWEHKVLSAIFEDGSHMYYNKQIGAVRFRCDGHTEATKKKISKSHKGKVRTEEHKNNISEAKLGVPHTEETKKKIGDAHRSNLSDFTEKADIIHNGMYDYSGAVYLGSHDNLTIICPTHGDFNQTPSNHLSGMGCNLCGDLRTAKSNNKKIDQYDKDGTYIKTWVSGKDISDTLDIPHSDLSKCCSKKNKTAKDYIWCYEGEEPSEWQLSDKLTTARKIDQYDKDGNYIKTWDSATDASDALEIQRGNISHCCLGNLKTAGGFKWKYA